MDKKYRKVLVNLSVQDREGNVTEGRLDLKIPGFTYKGELTVSIREGTGRTPYLIMYGDGTILEKHLIKLGQSEIFFNGNKVRASQLMGYLTCDPVYLITNGRV